MNLFERVLHIREAVVPAFQRGLQKLLRQRLKLPQHTVEPVLGDGVFAVRRGRYRRETDFPETDVLGQVPEDFVDIELVGRQRYPRADGPSAMPAQQYADLRNDDVVTAGAVGKDA